MRTIIIPATQEVYLQHRGGSDQDLHSGWRYRFHADLRPVPRRSYGYPGARREGGFHHQPQLCRPYGSYHRKFICKPGRRCRKCGSRLYLRTGRPEVREETHTMNAKGKVFKYGDNVDTDVIIPARYLNIADPKELSTHAMEDIDADFVKNMHSGDALLRPATSAAAPPVSTHRLFSVRTAFPALSHPRSRASSTATPSTSVCRSLSARQRRTASTQATR